MKLIALCSLLLLVSGCNSVDQKAVNSYIKAGNASLQGSVSYKGSGLFPRKQMYWVAKIDGNAVKEAGYFRAYPLSPGVHSITVGGGLFQGHVDSQETLGGEAELSLDGKSGHKYEVRGDVIERQISIYIFDLTANQTVTEQVRPVVHAETHKNPIFIPIIVP
ncbi:MAG TPA: hypothetical protein VL357_10985 [Rariglobus sp.]|jgi:hypothetical protein|nr:hypothetical protein [Rariglobus sp.]